jgi:hypothetical protein
MEPPKPNASYKEEGFMVKEFKYRIPPHVKKKQAGKKVSSRTLATGSIKDRNREWESLFKPPPVEKTQYIS